jgi:hypothetical protein
MRYVKRVCILSYFVGMGMAKSDAYCPQDYIDEHVDGCPNAHFASDHMALSTQFNFYD